MTTERDEIANLLDRHMSERDYDQGCRLSCGYSGDDRDEHLADAIIAAGFHKPRAIETVDELGALHNRTKLYTPRTGEVWWKRGNRSPRWEGSGGGYSETDDFLREQGPATVLWTPEGA